MTISRRDLLLGAGPLAAAGWLGLAARESLGSPDKKSEKEDAAPYLLPPLPYAYDALEPHIDRETMTLHHDIHHAGYVKGLNAALEKLAAARTAGDFSGVKALSKDLAFHGSGHLLHCIFWNNLSPEGGEPSAGLQGAIARDFGSFEGFQKHFSAAANSVEGSGWGILAFEPLSRRLLVMQAEKHQNLTAWGVVPLLVLDVWEHAYYVKYRNKRGAYVDAFWKIVNWADVSGRFDACQG